MLEKVKVVTPNVVSSVVHRRYAAW